MKLKSGKGIREFIMSGNTALKVGAVLLLGLLLILMGSLDAESEDTDTSLEERAAEMCSLMEGVGDCRVMMTYRQGEAEEGVYAVLILCEGAESPAVRERLTSLFCSLYGIGAHRVEIQKLTE